MRKHTVLLATALTTGLLTALPATAATAAPATGPTADFNGDGYGDLAIGVPFEDLGATEDAGAAILMNGSATGVSRTGARTVTQNTAGVPGTAEAIDYFGSDALLADVSKDGHAEFTVTATFEDEGIGAITALRGSSTGPVTDGAHTFGPGSLAQTRSYGAFGAGLIG
ncbi:FG-GAP repeat protein [Streptomyces tibetensis]|uniref:FG-GAP repeat protein n=1 Tax=Streptomyces tibetensis TaxID=2382123 RepID=UPI0033ECFBC5